MVFGELLNTKMVLRYCMGRGFGGLAAACFIVACSGSGISEDQVFTLYRNVPPEPNARTHFATFDVDRAGLSEGFNSISCWETQALLQDSKEWEGVKFWCEKGRFHK